MWRDLGGPNGTGWRREWDSVAALVNSRNESNVGSNRADGRSLVRSCQNALVGWALRAGEYHYRSPYGPTLLAIWTVFAGLLAVLPIWESVTRGGWYWLLSLWASGS
jgi:hypothetical protein